MSQHKTQKLPDQDYLNLMLEYSEKTGVVKYKDVFPEDMEKHGWTQVRCKIQNTRRAGKVAGHLFQTSSGTPAIQVRIDNKSYYLHRIIWKMVYGEDPILIDHIDGNPINNKLHNLRSVTNLENTRNTKRFKTNTSGTTGVSQDKTGKYEAYIWDKYKKIGLGRYDNIEDAIKVRAEYQEKLGYHENHGRYNEPN